MQFEVTPVDDITISNKFAVEGDNARAMTIKSLFSQRQRDPQFDRMEVCNGPELRKSFAKTVFNSIKTGLKNS